MLPKILIIAGSDSGGGAGIQADIKTVTALGCYATTAITALTAQNTQGVFGVWEVPAEFVQKQIDVVIADIGADVIKTGMLYDAEIIAIVAHAVQKYNKPFVFDPVMVATSGDALLEGISVVDAMKTMLIPQATIITPNIPEAEVLTGSKIESTDDMVNAGRKILAMGAGAVLVKGGHCTGDIISDVLLDNSGYVEIFQSQRIDTKDTHGTGCTLASAISCGLASGKNLRESVVAAKEYILSAIANSYEVGQGSVVLESRL